jgi:hypothetical protein
MGNLDNNSAGPAPEATRTECLSSNKTLFWRVFVPIFGTVFLLGLNAALLLISEENLYFPFPALWARLGAIALLLGWLFLVKQTIWRLKRVDANDTHFFVTNYWETVRYPWTDVVEIVETRRMGRRLVHFKLAATGRFGQVISMLASSQYDEVLAEWDVKKSGQGK